MLSIHVFIISWAGQHANAVQIANQIRGYASRVSIVYSDPDPAYTPAADCELLKRPDKLFWGDKFKACLDACNFDLMLVIHADCTSSDWPALVQTCHSTMDNNPVIGVWAPLIKGANMVLSKSHIVSIQASPLSIVAQTDAIVFALSASVIQRMKTANYEQNVYGWGIDDMAAAYCYSHNLIVVVDRSISVMHPELCGYSRKQAALQKAGFMKQLSFMETIQNRLLWSCIRLNYVKKSTDEHKPE